MSSMNRLNTSGRSQNKDQHLTDVLGLPCIENLVCSADETPEPIATTITGNIPFWIKGNFLRNGPGKFEIGRSSFNHWFDGMALMHQFHIEDGKVTYMSRFLNSDCYKENLEHNRIMVSEFGTIAMPDPCKKFFQRFLSRFELPSDQVTMRIRWKQKKSKFVAVNGATAHPHVDPDGSTYNMGNSYTRKGAFYNIIMVPSKKANPNDTLEGASVVCSIPSEDKSKPSYYHSFAMSENYVVFIEQPIKMDLLKIVTSKMRGKGINEGVYWDPKRNTVFHVINKHTGKLSLIKYYAKPLSTFHQINCYEENGFLIMDMCCSDDGQAINNYLIQNLKKSGNALDEVYNTMCRVFPRRFVLPLNVDSHTLCGQNLNTRLNSTATAIKTDKNKVFCTHEDLHGDDLSEYGGLEFPHINYSMCNSCPYRYFYGCGFRHLVGDSLIKMDLQGKQIKVWKHAGMYPSEPIFVSSPGAVEEEDGVILSVVITPNQDKSTFLLVLDTKRFEELGRAEVPISIPYGFHGTFRNRH
uniref:Beta,beta-carotene 9',10'-oxygenase-like n=1 Tax=Sinocyclocheilus rhinocerous TaxID=307959 RepID=A0A673K989_9TELE